MTFGVVLIGHDDDLAARKVRIDPGCMLSIDRATRVIEAGCASSFVLSAASITM